MKRHYLPLSGTLGAPPIFTGIFLYPMQIEWRTPGITRSHPYSDEHLGGTVTLFARRHPLTVDEFSSFHLSFAQRTFKQVHTQHSRFKVTYALASKPDRYNRLEVLEWPRSQMADMLYISLPRVQSSKSHDFFCHWLRK